MRAGERGFHRGAGFNKVEEATHAGFPFPLPVLTGIFYGGTPEKGRIMPYICYILQ